MKRNIQLVIIAAVILLVSCFAGARSFEKLSAQVEGVEPEFVLRYGEVNSEGHIMDECAQYFAKKVKQLSKGKVIVEIYASGQLGDDARCYQAMQMGALDLYRGNCISLTGDELPMVSVMALPYIFKDGEHFWNVCDSTLGDSMLADIENSCSGIKGLAFLDEGARCFFTTETPITELCDIQGLEIRTQVSDLMADTLSALGATSVPSEYVGLYSNLKGKTIDGAENPPISYYYNKFYEVAPYYVKDAHTYSPGVILISKITWENLGAEYQAIITEAAEMTQEYNQQRIQQAEQEAFEGMKEKGVIITELKDPEAWVEAVSPVYEKYGVGYSDLISQIRNMK